MGGPRPEILLGHRGFGLPADIWATGCILAEAAIREPLFLPTGLAAANSQVPYLHLIFKRLGAGALRAGLAGMWSEYCGPLFVARGSWDSGAAEAARVARPPLLQHSS